MEFLYGNAVWDNNCDHMRQKKREIIFISIDYDTPWAEIR